MPDLHDAGADITTTHRLAHVATALLCTASLAGAVASVLPSLASLSQPVPQSASSLPPARAFAPRETATSPFTRETASRDTHIIAHVDATESIVSPFATHNLAQLERTSENNPEHVTVDVQIERNAEPLQKALCGTGVIALTVAPFFLMRNLAAKQRNVAVAVALTAAGLAGSVLTGATVNVMREGVGQVVSAVADARHTEGVWSGRREMHMHEGERTEIDRSPSQQVDPKQVSGFIARHLQRYPEGHAVVTLTGHGLMYRHVSGFEGDAFGPMLAQATRDGGRPIDVLVLESCLAGNLEILNAAYPSARYAIVSEESIAAGAIGRALEATARDTAGEALSPRELAIEVLAHTSADAGVETLAVIDMSKLPALDDAVDRLGARLVSAMKTPDEAIIRQAVNDTMKLPLGQPSEAEMLAVGDLAQFAQNLINGYAGSTSPNAHAMTEEAQRVLGRLADVVVNARMTETYAAHGGISIQLPGAQMTALEGRSNVLGARGLSSHENARSPQGWRAFVTQMSARMAVPEASR